MNLLCELFSHFVEASSFEIWTFSMTNKCSLHCNDTLDESGTDKNRRHNQRNQAIMDQFRKVHVLVQLNPYIPLIEAYNAKNLKYDPDWQTLLHRAFWLFCATLIICVLPTFAVVTIWYLIENDADLKKCIVAFPIIVGLLQVEVTYITLVMKNHTISEMSQRLQRMIDQSELLIYIFSHAECMRSLIGCFSLFVAISSLIYAFFCVYCHIFYSFQSFLQRFQWQLCLFSPILAFLTIFLNIRSHFYTFLVFNANFGYCCQFWLSLWISAIDANFAFVNKYLHSPIKKTFYTTNSTKFLSSQDVHIRTDHIKSMKKPKANMTKSPLFYSK